MMRESIQISGDNISYVWLKAFQSLLEPGIESIVPLTVIITVQDELSEDERIRKKLDSLLLEHGLTSSRTTSSTIFPESFWNPGLDRAELFARYEKVLPTLKRMDGRNRYGMYFERLILSPSSDGKVFNQLNHVINTYKQGNQRRSALQAAIFDPRLDHSNQRQRGFPCLQQVFFTPSAQRELIVTGVYSTQYIFDRAYGNYLGLYALGRFMAYEMNLRLAQINCIATRAKLGSIGKIIGRAFARDCEIFTR